METIFMNSKNSKTSDPHILLLNFTDKIDLKISYDYVVPLNRDMLSMEKYKKVI